MTHEIVNRKGTLRDIKLTGFRELLIFLQQF